MIRKIPEQVGLEMWHPERMHRKMQEHLLPDPEQNVIREIRQNSGWYRKREFIKCGTAARYDESGSDNGTAEEMSDGMKSEDPFDSMNENQNEIE